jgi:hypothetical protein
VLLWIYPSVKLEIAGVGFLPVYQQGLSPIVSPSREGDSACNRGQHPAIKEIVR